jgi:ABC-type arginine transport system permease subunit
MDVLAYAALLAQEKSIAEEGRDIILVMLVVGLIFLGVILIGQASRAAGDRRAARRARKRVY